MARKITQDACTALLNGENFNRANTSVRDGEMFLHGNKIATFDATGLHICTAGWETVTTKERLNGLLKTSRVYTKKGQLMLGNEKWDGEWTKVL